MKLQQATEKVNQPPVYSCAPCYNPTPLPCGSRKDAKKMQSTQSASRALRSFATLRERPPLSGLFHVIYPITSKRHGSRKDAKKPQSTLRA